MKKQWILKRKVLGDDFDIASAEFHLVGNPNYEALIYKNGNIELLKKQRNGGVEFLSIKNIPKTLEMLQEIKAIRLAYAKGFCKTSKIWDITNINFGDNLLEMQKHNHENYTAQIKKDETVELIHAERVTGDILEYTRIAHIDTFAEELNSLQSAVKEVYPKHNTLL